MKNLYSAVIVIFSVVIFNSNLFSQTRIFSETFNSVTFPPAGWLVTNAGSGNNWLRTASASYIYEGAGAMQYPFNSSFAANTWAFTPGISMISGNQYYVVFYQSVAGASFPENLKVTIGNAQTVAGQTTLSDYPNLTNTAYTRRQTATYTAASTGTFYFAFNCYSALDEFYLNVDSVNIYEINFAPMSYVSSTTTQNTINVPLGSNNQQVIGLQVVTSGSLSPFNATSINFGTNGSTDPGNDITAARVYYTGTTGTYSPINQFGSDYTNPNGIFTISGSQVLSAGTNYFWLVYDISNAAAVGNVVDAECNQVTMNGAGGTQTPAITAPAGSRTIVSPLSGTVYVGTTEIYSSLTNAGGLFEAMNTYGLGGDLTAIVTSDLSETGLNALNQWPESGVGGYYLYIQPSAATIRNITGTVTQAMIRFNGADRVNIDGRFSGSGKYLRFLNLNNANPGISFLNDATNSTITYCTVETANSTTQTGGILFSTSTGSLGNSNNTISYCDIRDRSDAAGVPLTLIQSNGTASAQNSNNTVTYCNLFNCYANGNPGIFLYLTTGSTAWTISNNSFYETVTRTSTTTNTRLLPIYITNSLGNGFNVTGNYIGGTAPNCGGTPLILTTATTGVLNYMYGITLTTIGTTTASNIQNNTIQNIALTLIPPTGASIFPFIGINASTGSFNITGNTIGSGTGNGSITVNDNGIALTSTYAFYIDGMQVSPTGSCSITNNTIGSITLTGTNTTGTANHFMRGMLVVGTPTSALTIDNNLIGSNSTTNSIYANMTTTTRPQGILPILSSLSSAQTVNITNNTIRNVTNRTTATSNTGVTCITSSGTGVISNITGNTIKDVSSASLIATTTPGSVTVNGIYLTSTGTGQTISGNTITGLRSTTTNSITNAVYGIAISASGSTGTVSKNRIYDITNTSTNAAARLYGTNDYAGSNWTWVNNQICITNGEASLNKIPRSTEFEDINKVSQNTFADKVSIQDDKSIESILMSYASVKIENTIINKNSTEQFAPFITGINIPVGIREQIEETIRIKGINNEILPQPLTTSSADIQGFHEEFSSGTTGNYFYNTVYIGGIASGTTNSYCFIRSSTFTPTVNLKNNLFYNNRTGGTGFHVTISNNSGSVTGWNASASNYNTLITSNSSVLCRWSATNYDINGWRTISGGNDKQSWSTTTTDVTPLELFTNLSAGDLNIVSSNPEAWIVSGKGIALTGQNTDFSGDSRVTTISGGVTDIGADEFGTPGVNPPAATESAAPLGGTTTTYTLWGRTLAVIDWGLGGILYPTALTVNYFSGINHPNAIGGFYANSYSTVTPTGSLAGATYDITYYFGDNETYTIGTPSTNTILARYSTSWDIFPPGVNPWQTQLTFNTSTSVYTAKVTALDGFSSFALTDVSSPLPVNISSFTANIDRLRNVQLTWVTEYENNNAGFDVERRTVLQPTGTGKDGYTYTAWAKISFVQGNGTTNESHTYRFTDNKLNTGKYEYRLKQKDNNGSYEYYNLTNPDRVEIGKPFAADMSQNYPNPSNPKCKIDYQLPYLAKVSIKVYDIIGREVITLVNELKQEGYYTAEFDGTNLASGMYFYRIVMEGNGENYTATKKMVIVK